MPFAVLLCACSGKQAEESPAPKAAPAASAASEWLERSQLAAENMASYAFELQMTQILGQPGDSERTTVRVDMNGRAEREPFILDQTIKSDIDGEVSTLRAIVTPEAYYMYLPEFEEWSRLSEKVAAENMETLSEFQSEPESAVGKIRALGEGLTAESDGTDVTVRYDGNGPATKAFAAGLLRSTLGLTESEETIADRLEIAKLKVFYRMDAVRNWPLSYRIETELTVELEPNRKTAISQTLAGTYSKPNATERIVVPKEALKAPNPEEIEKDLDFGGEES